MKDFHTENLEDEKQLHHSSINDFGNFGSQIQGNDEGLEDLEFVEDPLNKKKKINEVLNLVKFNLMDDGEDQSAQSDSRNVSQHNTIDATRSYVLKQQFKNQFLNKNKH